MIYSEVNAEGIVTRQVEDTGENVKAVEGGFFVNVALPVGSRYVPTAGNYPLAYAELNSGGEGVPAAKALEQMSAAELRAVAEAEEIDLGDSTKKADIVEVIKAAREAKVASAA